MNTLQHPLLKDPIYTDVHHCFDELTKEDQAQDDAIDVAKAWIGKLLEKVEFDAVSKIFDLATGTDGFLGEVADDLTHAADGIKGWLTDNIKDQVEEFTKSKLASDNWSPVANALYKVGKKACVTILPILVKGTAVATALGSAFVAGAPLWILGVIITYSIAQEKHDRVKVNTWLSYRLIDNLNKCREKALKTLLAREARETATTLGKAWVDDEEKVVMRVLVNEKKAVRIDWGNIRVVAEILKTHGFSIKDIDGHRTSFTSRDSDVEWPMVRIFIFLQSKLGAQMPRDEATAAKLELDKVDKNLKPGIAKILEESNFVIPDER